MTFRDKRTLFCTSPKFLILLLNVLYLCIIHVLLKGLYGLSDPGAIEKQKLVYILNRDAAARLTISSPLEAHKANTLVYHVVGVDVGFENPMFACLEMDYEVRMQHVYVNVCFCGVCS